MDEMNVNPSRSGEDETSASEEKDLVGEFVTSVKVFRWVLGCFAVLEGF